MMIEMSVSSDSLGATGRCDNSLLSAHATWTRYDNETIVKCANGDVCLDFGNPRFGGTGKLILVSKGRGQ